MPLALFQFPMGENVVDGVFNGILVPREFGAIGPSEYDDTVFKLRTESAAAYYCRVREQSFTGHLQVKDGPDVLAEGDILLKLVPVTSGITPVEILDPQDGPGEEGLANFGGWYGEASTQPNWVKYIDEDGNPTAATPFDPGPITLRFGDCTPEEGFTTEDDVEYITIASRQTAGPTISFLDFFGDGGVSFGSVLGSIVADVNGVLPAVLGVPESGFALKLGGPVSGPVTADLVGTLTLEPSRYWGYDGRFDETSGARL